MAEASLPSDFISALKALAEWFESEKVPHATIGGVAVSLIAEPRATQDIDAVIWFEENRWETLLESAAAHGFVPRISEALDFAGKARVLLLKHRTSGVNIDLSLGALEFEREMIERATLLVIGALKLRVATPEDLIVTKAVAQRAKDIADIESILNIQKNLDLARIRHWTYEFANALDMPEVQESVERLLRRQQGTDKSSP